MERLADVELQLVMHGLDSHSLLSLARSCKRLLQVVDAPFAWKHCRLEINSADASFPSVRVCPLMRHASVTLRWLFNRDRPASSLVDAVLTFASSTRLRELDTSDWTASPTVWDEVLAHPSFRQLRVLRVDLCGYWAAVATKVMRLIVDLPRLDTLALAPDSNTPLSAMEILPTAPALTCLHLTETRSSTVSYLPIIAQCTMLTELSVRQPNFKSKTSEDGFHSFVTAPGMHQLRTLTLRLFDAALIPTLILTAGKECALPSLQTLTLISVIDLDRLLPSLLCFSSLAALHIRDDPADRRSLRESGRSTPSAAALVALLRVMHMLHCTMIRLDEQSTIELQTGVDVAAAGNGKIARRISIRCLD